MSLEDLYIDHWFTTSYVFFKKKLIISSNEFYLQPEFTVQLLQ